MMAQRKRGFYILLITSLVASPLHAEDLCTPPDVSQPFCEACAQKKPSLNEAAANVQKAVNFSWLNEDCCYATRLADAQLEELPCETSYLNKIAKNRQMVEMIQDDTSKKILTIRKLQRALIVEQKKNRRYKSTPYKIAEGIGGGILDLGYRFATGVRSIATLGMSEKLYERTPTPDAPPSEEEQKLSLEISTLRASIWSSTDKEMGKLVDLLTNAPVVPGEFQSSGAEWPGEKVTGDLSFDLHATLDRMSKNANSTISTVRSLRGSGPTAKNSCAPDFRQKNEAMCKRFETYNGDKIELGWQKIVGPENGYLRDRSLDGFADKYFHDPSTGAYMQMPIMGCRITQHQVNKILRDGNLDAIASGVAAASVLAGLAPGIAGAVAGGSTKAAQIGLNMTRLSLGILITDVGSSVLTLATSVHQHCSGLKMDSLKYKSCETDKNFGTENDKGLEALKSELDSYSCAGSVTLAGFGLALSVLGASQAWSHLSELKLAARGGASGVGAAGAAAGTEALSGLGAGRMMASGTNPTLAKIVQAEIDAAEALARSALKDPNFAQQLAKNLREWAKDTKAVQRFNDSMTRVRATLLTDVDRELAKKTVTKIMSLGVGPEKAAEFMDFISRFSKQARDRITGAINKAKSPKLLKQQIEEALAELRQPSVGPICFPGVPAVP